MDWLGRVRTWWYFLIFNPYMYIEKTITLKHRRQSLDGFRWVNCVFEDCVIVIEEGRFSLIGCSFIRCKLVLEGRAANVIKLFEMFDQSKRSKVGNGITCTDAQNQ